MSDRPNPEIAAKELAHCFVKEGYSGYAYYIEHVWKGGILRLLYENGSIVEKAHLLNDGSWQDAGLGGIYKGDNWYDSCDTIHPRDDMQAVFHENLKLTEGLVVDALAPARVRIRKFT